MNEMLPTSEILFFSTIIFKQMYKNYNELKTNIAELKMIDLL